MRASNPLAQRVNIFDAVKNGALRGAPIQAFFAHFNTMQQNAPGGVDQTVGPLDALGFPLLNFMQDWRRDFFSGVYNGQFNTYRAAAEFVHGLVSDHLPVIAQVDW